MAWALRQQVWPASRPSTSSRAPPARCPERESSRCACCCQSVRPMAESLAGAKTRITFSSLCTRDRQAPRPGGRGPLRLRAPRMRRRRRLLGRRADRRGHDDAGRGPGAQRRRRSGRGHLAAQAEHGSPRLRTAARRREGAHRRERGAALGRRGGRLAGGRAPRRGLGRAGGDARPRHGAGAALVAGPARRDGRGGEDPGRARPGGSRRAIALRRRRAALPGGPAPPRPLDRPLHRDDPARPAQARHDPRRARRLRAPLRAGGHRDRDPVALDPRPGVGGPDGGARPDAAPRARAGGVRRELRAPRRRAGDRPRGRRARRAAAVGGLARAEGLGGRHLHRVDGGQLAHDRRRPRRRPRPLPAGSLTVLDTFSAPYMQRALLEIGLLAVLAGVLGAWIVLRRLAFFTHSVGTAAFPGLVVAGPWGIAPQLAALGAALGFAGARERLARGRAGDEDAATGILLVGALALGALLASDVYRAGAEVDRLLFGTLIGLSDRDVLLTAAAAAAVLVAHGALRRAWLARAFDPEGASACC